MNSRVHSFHIPVMGIGYTIDTPVKVAHLGIDSVISLVDDGLMEKMRAFYCRSTGRHYSPITVKAADYRAERITAYLNLVDDLVSARFDALMNDSYEPGTELHRYVSLLPENSQIRAAIKPGKPVSDHNRREMESALKKQLVKGSIDVNIMSKGDTVRYKNSHEELPAEFNDAHAAVRGFLKSRLENSSLIISAGLNPKLFSYLGTFDEIQPDADGHFTKKIVLKVSDYRSAQIQGKFLAQRGVWVSGFRIESGLNCGGHAFATKGFFLGPILNEFQENLANLEKELYAIYAGALQGRGIILKSKLPPIVISAQGGIGTSRETDFLVRQYNLSTVGWGSSFLLVPEVVNVDPGTLALLSAADENTIYLSDTSPFGIPFYTIRGNTKDREKALRIEQNVPGSTCPKRYVALNSEFGKPALCTASREYQKLKIENIRKEESDPSGQALMIAKVTAKTCICVGLGTAALLVNGLERRLEGEAVSICPGPNLAYFSQQATLNEMVDHIYGRTNLILRKDRPHVLIREIHLYLEYSRNALLNDTASPKQKQYLSEFRENMLNGIRYYEELFRDARFLTGEERTDLLSGLSRLKDDLLSDMIKENPATSDRLPV